MTTTTEIEFSNDNLTIAAIEVRVAKKFLEAIGIDLIGLDRALRVLENTQNALRDIYVTTGNTDVFDILHPKKN